MNGVTQGVLRGFDEGKPKKRRSKSGSLKPMKAKRRWPGTFLGKLIPIPVDSSGEPYKDRDFQVLLRADGAHIVCDWRRNLGDAEIFWTTSGLRRALIVFQQWVHFRHWAGPIPAGMTRTRVLKKNFRTWL